MLQKITISIIGVLLLITTVGLNWVFADDPVTKRQSDNVVNQPKESLNQPFDEPGDEPFNQPFDEEGEPFEEVDWFLIVADILEIDEDTLWLELDNGQSIAEIAQTKDIAVQTLVDAIIAAEEKFIADLLTEGEINQAEADEWLVDLEIEAYFFIVMPEEVDWLAVAAQVLDVDEETVWDALDSGQSLADMAKARDIDPQTIVDGIITAETDSVNQALAADLISQAQADEWLAMTPDFITEYVEDTAFFEMMDDDFFDEVDWFMVAAETLAIDEETLWDELDAGKNLADMAKTRDIDPQTIVEAIIAAETELINNEVANNFITQAEADEWLTDSQKFATEFVEDTAFFLEMEEDFEEEFSHDCD